MIKGQSSVIEECGEKMNSDESRINKIVLMLKRFLFDSQIRFDYLSKLGVFNWMNDESYLKLLYQVRTGEKLNLDNPTRLNEKLQWLKINNRKTQYTMLADKYLVKEYIKESIGEKYVVPLLGMWENVEDINFDLLPEKFVIKCNHTSSTGVVICRDKKELNLNDVKTQLKTGLKTNYYYRSREWPYKNIKRVIFAEEFLENQDGSEIIDYKFYCYGGEPRYFMVSYGEASHHVRNHKFDMDLRSIDYLFKDKPVIDEESICMPNNIQEMIAIVRKLAVGFPHIRIDLYNVNGKVYFGEFTFYSGGGFINIKSREYEQQLADYIDVKDYEEII